MRGDDCVGRTLLFDPWGISLDVRSADAQADAAAFDQTALFGPANLWGTQQPRPASDGADDDHKSQAEEEEIEPCTVCETKLPWTIMCEQVGQQPCICGVCVCSHVCVCVGKKRV